VSVATIDPGRPSLLMDHFQLGLRPDSRGANAPGGAGAAVAAGEGGASGTAGAPEPHFYLSLYVIPWSREMGAGHVALLRYRGPGGLAADVTLTDNPSLGRAQQANLRSVGYSRVDLSSEPRPASFIRSPLADQDHARYLISAPGLEIEARWDDLGEAIFAYGPAPQRPETQRIWSVLFEAGQGSATVNGVAVPGHTYAMESWIPWLGRTLHSAHVARSEILVENGPG
jgi:hypothetical protein